MVDVATRSNNLKFVGDCIEDVTVTCFRDLLASYQALSDHGVANDLNSVGDSVAKHPMESRIVAYVTERGYTCTITPIKVLI